MGYWHGPIYCHFISHQFGDCFYFCVKSLTCFLVGQHHCCSLDRVLQTSAVGLHLPSSHPLVPNCIRVREKENDLNGIYLAQRDEDLAGRGSSGPAALNSKGKPWKLPGSLPLSYCLGINKQLRKLSCNFATFYCVIIPFSFFIIFPWLTVENNVPSTV